MFLLGNLELNPPQDTLSDRQNRQNRQKERMCSIANYCPKPSFGQPWNPNHLRFNRGFHASVTPISSSSSFSKVSASIPKTGYTRVSESLVFPSVHRPRTPPRGIVHFIGGAFIGAVPEATYRYVLDQENKKKSSKL